MTIVNAVALLTACLIFGPIAALIRTAYRLRRIPGPFLSRLTNIPRAIWVQGGFSHITHTKLHDKYGDVVVFGPRMVDVSNPDALSTIYPLRSGFPKGDFYRALMPFTRTGSALPLVFNTRDEDLHKQMKTPIASIFSLTSVLVFEKFIDEVTTVMFMQLDARFAAKGELCNLGDWLQFYAFEVMATMTFSERYGFLDQGRDANGLIEAVWTYMKTAAPMTQIPWLDKVLYKNILAAKLRPTTGMPILNLALQNIAKRRENTANGARDKRPKHGDMLDQFLRVQSSKNNIPESAPISWTFSNLIAGSDSTAVIMRTLWYNLLAHSESGKKLQKELRDARLSMPHPTWMEIRDLPFLDACMKEAVRMHPPFCLPLERVCPAEGVSVCGHFLPGKTVVGMNPWVVNRHKNTFGADADEWRPERWIECTPDRRKKMDASVLTFGFGRRICLGKHIAVLEIKKLTAALILRYDAELVDRHQYRTENFWFFRQLGLKVKLQPRQL